MKKTKDLTGDRFGKLTVESFVGRSKYGERMWKCKCDCGGTSIVRQSHLLSGHSTTCGCGKPQLKDYTGRLFGHLTVLGRIDDYVCPGNGKHYVRYKCRCDCGNEKDVIALNLKNGCTTSCGCHKPHGVFEDLSGQRFGLLTVLHRVDDYVNPSGRKLIRYKCRCDCGNEIYALANALRNGDVGSCGCIVRSRGEEFVRNWMKSHNIKYELHKTFDGCLSIYGHKLSYDFWIPNFHALIECNGIQHYEPVEFFGGDKKFEEQKQNDVLKCVFAEKHSYPYLVLDCRDIDEKAFDTKLSEFIANCS